MTICVKTNVGVSNKRAEHIRFLVEDCSHNWCLSIFILQIGRVEFWVGQDFLHFLNIASNCCSVKSSLAAEISEVWVVAHLQPLY